MRNEVLPRTGCFVLDELEDPGTHWVSVYNNEYYDSFGLPPPKKLEKTISWYNTRQHQNVVTVSPGFLASHEIAHMLFLLATCRSGQKCRPFSACAPQISPNGRQVCKQSDGRSNGLCCKEITRNEGMHAHLINLKCRYNC